MNVYVRLRLAAEEYAVPVMDVLEIAELGTVIPVPGAPSVVLGVRNLRGQILPVIDLTQRLNIARNAPAGSLMVARLGGRPAGVAIDEVRGVAELPEPTGDTESELLTGVLLHEGTLIGILDMARVASALEAVPS